MTPRPEIGTPEWCDRAEKAEWAFMAKMMREVEHLLPHKLSGLRVAIDIAEARSNSGWREFRPLTGE